MIPLLLLGIGGIVLLFEGCGDGERPDFNTKVQGDADGGEQSKILVLETIPPPEPSDADSSYQPETATRYDPETGCKDTFTCAYGDGSAPATLKDLYTYRPVKMPNGSFQCFSPCAPLLDYDQKTIIEECLEHQASSSGREIVSVDQWQPPEIPADTLALPLPKTDTPGPYCAVLEGGAQLANYPITGENVDAFMGEVGIGWNSLFHDLPGTDEHATSKDIALSHLDWFGYDLSAALAEAFMRLPKDYLPFLGSMQFLFQPNMTVGQDMSSYTRILHTWRFNQISFDPMAIIMEERCLRQEKFSQEDLGTLLADRLQVYLYSALPVYGSPGWSRSKIPDPNEKMTAHTQYGAAFNLMVGRHYYYITLPGTPDRPEGVGMLDGEGGNVDGFGIFAEAAIMTLDPARRPELREKARIDREVYGDEQLTRVIDYVDFFFCREPE